MAQSPVSSHANGDRNSMRRIAPVRRKPGSKSKIRKLLPLLALLMERFKKVSAGLSPTIRIKGAPRIRIVRHLVGAGVSPFARTLGRPLRIVKLIGHAKTGAPYSRPTLLDGKEAAVGGSESPVDVKQRRCQHKRRNNFGHKAHLHLLAAIGNETN
jgi:hypothetical protein